MSLLAKKAFIGIDLGHHAMKAVQVERTTGGWRVLKQAIAPTPPDTIRDGVVIDPPVLGIAIKNMLRAGHFSATTVGIAVSGNSVVVRPVRMPKMAEAALRKSIRFEASRYVPNSIEDSYIDFEIVDNDLDASMDVLVVAAPKDLVDSRIQACEAAGLEVETAEIGAFAAYRAIVEANFEYDWSEKTIAHLDIGSTITNLSIVGNGRFLMTRAIPSGGLVLTDALKSYFKLSDADAEKGKAQLDLRDLLHEHRTADNPPLRVLHAHVDDLIREVRRSINYWQSQQQDGPAPQVTKQIDQIILSGGGSKMPGLVEYFDHKLGVPTMSLGLFDNPRFVDAYETHEHSAELAIATGLAMTLAPAKVAPHTAKVSAQNTPKTPSSPKGKKAKKQQKETQLPTLATETVQTSEDQAFEVPAAFYHETITAQAPPVAPAAAVESDRVSEAVPTPDLVPAPEMETPVASAESEALTEHAEPVGDLAAPAFVIDAPMSDSQPETLEAAAAQSGFAEAPILENEARPTFAASSLEPTMGGTTGPDEIEPSFVAPSLEDTLKNETEDRSAGEAHEAPPAPSSVGPSPVTAHDVLSVAGSEKQADKALPFFGKRPKSEEPVDKLTEAMASLQDAQPTAPSLSDIEFEQSTEKPESGVEGKTRTESGAESADVTSLSEVHPSNADVQLDTYDASEAPVASPTNEAESVTGPDILDAAGSSKPDRKALSFFGKKSNVTEPKETLSETKNKLPAARPTAREKPYMKIKPSAAKPKLGGLLNRKKKADAGDQEKEAA